MAVKSVVKKITKSHIGQTIWVDPKQLVFVCNMREVKGDGKLYNDKLAASFASGIQSPILVTVNGEIVDGHTRIQWAIDNSKDAILALVLDISKEEIPIAQFKSFDRVAAGNTGVLLAVQNYLELNPETSPKDLARLFEVSIQVVYEATGIQRKLPEVLPLIKQGYLTPSTAKAIAHTFPEKEEREPEDVAKLSAIVGFIEKKNADVAELKKPITVRALNAFLGTTDFSPIRKEEKEENTKKESLSLKSVVQRLVYAPREEQDSKDPTKLFLTLEIDKELWRYILSYGSEKPVNKPETIQTTGQTSVIQLTFSEFPGAGKLRELIGEYRVEDGLVGVVADNGKFIVERESFTAFPNHIKRWFKELKPSTLDPLYISTRTFKVVETSLLKEYAKVIAITPVVDEGKASNVVSITETDLESLIDELSDKDLDTHVSAIVAHAQLNTADLDLDDDDDVEKEEGQLDLSDLYSGSVLEEEFLAEIEEDVDEDM